VSSEERGAWAFVSVSGRTTRSAAATAAIHSVLMLMALMTSVVGCDVRAASSAPDSDSTKKNPGQGNDEKNKDKDKDTDKSRGGRGPRVG
jgi:hypothetical protein